MDRRYQNGGETTLIEVLKVTRLEVQDHQLFRERESGVRHSVPYQRKDGSIL